MNAVEGKVRPSRTLKFQDVDVMESWLCEIPWKPLTGTYYKCVHPQLAPRVLELNKLCPVLLLLLLFHHQTSAGKSRRFLNVHSTPRSKAASFPQVLSSKLLFFKKPFVQWCLLPLVWALLYKIIIPTLSLAPQTSNKRNQDLGKLWLAQAPRVHLQWVHRSNQFFDLKIQGGYTSK